MPYDSNSDLPDRIKSNLPEKAQTVFRTVVNRELADGANEESAFKQAWTAVKNGWKQDDEGQWIKKSEPGSSDVHVDSTNWNDKKKKKQISIQAGIAKVDDSLGLVFGYAMVCKIDGQEHFDLQGHHIPEDTMLKVLAKFMEKGAIAKEMHSGKAIGKYVFAFPLTTEIAKALDIQCKQTGALVAMKPDNESTLQKFRSGEFTGFSIGGINPIFEDAA